MSEWVDVKDRLPPEGDRVLTIDARNPERIQYRLDCVILFERADEPFIWGCRLQDEMDFVTHWMPLPEAPK